MRKWELISTIQKHNMIQTISTWLNWIKHHLTFQLIKDDVRNAPVRSSRMSLGIFLFKLRSGISNKLLSTIFAITKSSIRQAIASVRVALTVNFVPLYLGFQHITRQDVIDNYTRPIAQAFLATLEKQMLY